LWRHPLRRVDQLFGDGEELLGKSLRGRKKKKEEEKEKRKKERKKEEKRKKKERKKEKGQTEQKNYNVKHKEYMSQMY
jgi:hypothetical protein